MHIFISVGEPSGDQHAAHLIRELRSRRPDVEVSGFGGPNMQAEGCRILFRLTDLAVMFLWSVVPLLAKFYRLLKRADRFFKDERPDAVVLVDYPGFNWHIARKARAAGIPVFYYLPPQLWAWGPWRVKKMRKLVDRVLCALPFEPQWYAQRGIHAEYVGHPFFDEIAEHSIDAAFCRSLKPDNEHPPDRRPLLGVLPGSRDKEIERNWPTMLEVMQQIHAEVPGVRFAVASFNKRQRDRCVQIAKEAGVGLPLEYSLGKTPEIIETADCCLMVSGSVSLELLSRTTPAAVIYSITRATRFFKWVFLNCKYITLPNLFAGEEVLPEWIFTPSSKTHVAEISETLSGWLTDTNRRQRAVEKLEQLRAEVFRRGAGGNTANAILEHLSPVASQPANRAA